MLTPTNFAEEPFISISRSTQLRMQIDTFFLSKGVKRRLSQETPISIVACSLVAAGAGLAIVDPFTAQASGDLDVVFRPLEPRIDVQFGIITTTDTPDSGPANDFIAGIEAEVRSFAASVLMTG